MAKKSIKKLAKKKTVKKIKKSPAKKTIKKTLKKSVAKKPLLKKPESRSAKQTDFAKLISPLDDRILVQIENLERVTAGGLFIPDTADVSGNRKAKVVAVGRGHLDKKGKIRPLEIQIGNLILLPEYAGDDIEISGQKLKIIREGDVLGVVEK